MTDILKRVIEKAVKGGWVYTQEAFDYLMHGLNNQEVNKDLLDYFIREKRHYAFIFDISFAKAFWGESWRTWTKPENLKYAPWQYHLQQLALAEDRLEYLGRFL